MDHSLMVAIAIIALLPSITAEQGLRLYILSGLDGPGFSPPGRLELAFYDATHAFNATTRQRMVDTFMTVYPKQVNMYNADASKKVTFIIDAFHESVASTVGDIVVFNADYLSKNPGNVDVVTHECMHVVQAYKDGVPVWAVDGIADYVRYALGVDNASAGWTLPAFDKSQKYTDSYRVAARFFLWIEKTVKAGFVKAYNQALREGTHATFFQTFTGKTVDQLWAQYAQNPAIPGL